MQLNYLQTQANYSCTESYTTGHEIVALSNAEPNGQTENDRKYSLLYT